MRALADLTDAEQRLTRRLEREKNASAPMQQLGDVKGRLARLAAKRGQADQAQSLVKEAISFQRRALELEPVNRLGKELLENHQALGAELATDSASSSVPPVKTPRKH